MSGIAFSRPIPDALKAQRHSFMVRRNLVVLAQESRDAGLHLTTRPTCPSHAGHHSRGTGAV